MNDKWRGTHCELRTCADNPCQHDGDCIDCMSGHCATPNTTMTIECRCTIAYSGKFCERVDPWFVAAVVTTALAVLVALCRGCGHQRVWLVNPNAAFVAQLRQLPNAVCIRVSPAGLTGTFALALAAKVRFNRQTVILVHSVGADRVMITGAGHAYGMAWTVASAFNVFGGPKMALVLSRLSESTARRLLSLPPDAMVPTAALFASACSAVRQREEPFHQGLVVALDASDQLSDSDLSRLAEFIAR